MDVNNGDWEEQLSIQEAIKRMGGHTAVRTRKSSGDMYRSTFASNFILCFLRLLL